jgi:hypothetical protein
VLKDGVAQVKDDAVPGLRRQVEPGKVDGALHEGEGEQAAGCPPDAPWLPTEDVTVDREADDPRRRELDSGGGQRGKDDASQDARVGAHVA